MHLICRDMFVKLKSVLCFFKLISSLLFPDHFEKKRNNTCNNKGKRLIVFDSIQVLFIKNLHHKVTEADLVSLFLGFQEKLGPKITFRLMKGKMNGQAFVTMPGWFYQV